MTAGFTDLIAVTDVDSAVQAINLIVEQGEGTTTSPLDPQDDPAHYYRFAEVYYGKTRSEISIPVSWRTGICYMEAIRSPSIRRVVTTGELIRRLQTTPLAARRLTRTTISISPIPHAQVAASRFQRQPDRIAPAVQLMESMKLQVRYLTTIEVSNGLYAGPSFQYRPVND